MNTSFLWANLANAINVFSNLCQADLGSSLALKRLVGMKLFWDSFLEIYVGKHAIEG